MKPLAPIVLFVYNRPDHTRETIDALAKNLLAKESILFIYSDGAKDNQKDRGLVEEVREIINNPQSHSFFKFVKIIESQTNKGLAKSVIDGVTDVINEYKRVIVLEDDLVSTEDFLSYMNGGLEYYEKDSQIWSISGYSFKMKFPKDYTYDIFYTYRGSSWGYATWKDRWATVDWDVLDYKDFKSNIRKRKKLNRGGVDMAEMLDSQIAGEIDSWAIRWCYAQSKQDKYTVYPVLSRIKNIGLDGSGTHSKQSKENQKWESALNKNQNPVIFAKLSINTKINRAFRARYGGFLSATRQFAKSMILMVLGRIDSI